MHLDSHPECANPVMSTIASDQYRYVRVHVSIVTTARAFVPSFLKNNSSTSETRNDRPSHTPTFLTQDKGTTHTKDPFLDLPL